VILNYCWGFRGLQFSNRKNKTKLVMGYEIVTQDLFFDIAVLAALVSGRK
jgi:hypothetical protein